MWPSLAVGQSTHTLNMGDETLTQIATALASHPLLKSQPLLAKGIASQTLMPTIDQLVTPSIEFSPTGESWFETHVGKSARDIVKELKKVRRTLKSSKSEIDAAIEQVRLLKRMEVEATLAKLSWSSPHQGTIRQLGLSDKTLKSLRLFGNRRETSLIRACNVWENADSTLKQLDEFQDVWGDEERLTWVNAMQQKSDARKMWKSALHQIESLTEEQQKWLKMAKQEVEQHGSMTARAITENMITKGVPRINATRMSKLLNMYGEEICIIKAPRKGEYMCIDQSGLIIKDPWAYAAGFLDADGYITITERGEPRAGFLATGERGRMHCEELHKNIGAGILQLDQKIYSDSQKSQHRVTFYSKDDLTKLLDKITPHLKMKDIQAKAVVAFINEKDPLRKTKLKRLVQFSNRDGTTKGEESLRDLGVDKDTVLSWAEGL